MILVTTFKVFINLLVFRRPEALPIVPQLAESKMDMIKSIPVHMDYVGQGRAEKLYQVNLEMLNQLRSQQFDHLSSKSDISPTKVFLFLQKRSFNHIFLTFSLLNMIYRSSLFCLALLASAGVTPSSSSLRR